MSHTAVYCTINLCKMNARVVLRLCLFDELFPCWREVSTVAAVWGEMLNEPNRKAARSAHIVGMS